MSKWRYSNTVEGYAVVDESMDTYFYLFIPMNHHHHQQHHNFSV